MYLTIMKPTAVMAMMMTDENRSNEGVKVVCNINVGKSSDGDNGDGDNSDGIINNIGGNDSNDVGNPPDSGDAVGERKKK
jgi:hypothetical protein